MGRITAFNGKTEQEVFKDDLAHCNVINGSDKSVFPPFQDKNDVLWSFIPQACRSVTIRYHTERKRIHGIKTYFKQGRFDDEDVRILSTINNFSKRQCKTRVSFF